MAQAADESSAPTDEEHAFAGISDAHLRATWQRTIHDNIVAPFEGKQKLFKKEWPAGCLFTNIESASTTTKRGKNPRSYPRKGVVKLPSDAKASKQKIGLHQLAAYISGGRKPKGGEQASHYACDNTECVNPGHIVFESADANGTRHCCKVYKDLTGYRCPHQPTCPGAQSCLDS